MAEIQVHTKPAYTVKIGDGILSQCGPTIRQVSSAEKAVVITDDHVNPLYGNSVLSSLRDAGFETELFVFPHGESSKSHHTLVHMYDFLCEKKVTRSDLLIALGGGVVGDITGFCAATFLRGLDYIQLPTTFLAQIDSSVGGKTAIDIAGGKNLVGAFKQPRLVLCDIATLSTLPRDVFADGVAEAIKYGMIKSANIFNIISNGELHQNLSQVIYECIDIKRSIVEEDEFDQGQRMLLNFGHTFGHAIETQYHFDTYTHGMAVGIGMMKITRLSERYGITAPGTTDRLKQCLQQYELPTDAVISNEDLIRNSLVDKKASGNSIHIILARSVGDSFILKLSKDEYKKFVCGGYQCDCSF